MPVISSAIDARNRLDSDIEQTLAATRWEWQQMTPYLDDSWSRVGPRMTSLVTAGQIRTAERAPLEVAQMLDEQGLSIASEGTIKPVSLAGIASDGRALESLLYQSIVIAGQALNTGTVSAEALNLGWQWLEQAISSQIADANRVAASVQSLLSPAAILNVRVVNPGACSRCIALAGIETGAKTAFLRHPECRCKNIPTGQREENVGTDPIDYFNSMSKAEQDHAFTKAGAQAIRDGADLHQVVNARRGMTTTATGRLKRGVRGTYTTSEGMTRRGYARNVMAQNPNWVKNMQGRKIVKNARLMPESIYELAKDKKDAIRLLKAYGYFDTSTTKKVLPLTKTGNASGGGKKPPISSSIGSTPGGFDRYWLNNFGNKPPFLPPSDWSSLKYWSARQSALPVKFHGEIIEPHEVRFVEKMISVGQKVEWIPRDIVGRRSTNDFIWTNRNQVRTEFKKAPANYKKIADHISAATLKARSHGVIKDVFVIDIQDKALTDKLKMQLGKYNMRRPDALVREIWVMSQGELTQIRLQTK